MQHAALVTVLLLSIVTNGPVISGKEPNGTGGESLPDTRGGFICPLCASWCTLTVPLWMTVVHAAATGEQASQLKDLSFVRSQNGNRVSKYLKGICKCNENL